MGAVFSRPSRKSNRDHFRTGFTYPKFVPYGNVVVSVVVSYESEGESGCRASFDRLCYYCLRFQ